MAWYALATCRRDAGTATALVIDNKLYDLAAACQAAGQGAAAWATASVAGLVADWPAVQAAIDSVAQATAAAAAAGKVKPLPTGTPLAAPLRPQRIFAAAANYAEHAKEMGTALAAKENSRPYFFMKPSTAVVGPDDVVRKPEETSKLDWEVELGVVIGRRAKNVHVSRALDVIAGYTVVNDVSARDLNKRTDTPFAFDWFQGKCWDTFAPVGPWIVPARFIADPQNLHLELKVNGKVMQNDSSSTMIWTVREQIAYLSTLLTLEPGDVIATGTPTGVGAAHGIFLKAGDVMEATVESIGTLRNPVANSDTSPWGAMK